MSNKQYSIAILLATRGREDSLGLSIHSLIDYADDISRVQFFFAFDNDDTVGLNYFNNTLKPELDEKKIAYTALKFPRLGYIGLHKYNNAMAKQANADWLCIWNDDAVMETKGWDSEIVKRTGEFKLLSYRTHMMHPYSIFPIVPVKWFELLGYISPHPTQDGWVSQQAYMLDIYERIPVDVLHDRFDLTGNNQDETFNNRPMLEGKPEDPRDFHSKEMLYLRHSDANKLAAYMQSIGMSTEFFENIFAGKQDPWEKLAKNDINGLMVQFKNPHAEK